MRYVDDSSLRNGNLSMIRFAHPMILVISLCITALLHIPASAQEMLDEPSTDPGSCWVGYRPVKNKLMYAKPGGEIIPEPLIYGEKYKVPALHVRFVKLGTNEPIIPDRISLYYTWEWIEYPYPEHAWGAWDGSHDSIDCLPQMNNELTVPPYEVVARGWYDGKYTRVPWPKKPRFAYLEFRVFFSDSCHRAFLLSKRQLDMFKKKVAVMPLSCRAVDDVRFEDIKAEASQ